MATITLAANSAHGEQPPASGPAKTYAIVDRIPAYSRLWDYAAIDPSTRRLYLANEGVTALDLATRHVTVRLLSGEMTHGVVPIGHGSIAVADATHHRVILFAGMTGKILGTVATEPPPTREGWHNPDALVLDPKTGLLVAVNSDSGSLSLIDVNRRRLIQTVPIGDQLEFIAVDGAGLAYVNMVKNHSIAVVDIVTRQLVKTIELMGCEEPTGLAYDSADEIVMSVCDNGLAKFMNAKTGAELGNVVVGKGADAILYDRLRHSAFITSGDTGTLTVVAIKSGQQIAVMQTVRTRYGVRLGALDERTGRIYLPSVEYDRSAAPVRLSGLPPLPAAIPQTFEFLVVGPKKPDLGFLQ